jgi:hypothetical protein
VLGLALTIAAMIFARELVLLFGSGIATTRRSSS